MPVFRGAFTFPSDEQRLPWLSLLLDAYSIADTGVAIAITGYGEKAEENSRLRKRMRHLLR